MKMKRISCQTRRSIVAILFFVLMGVLLVLSWNFAVDHYFHTSAHVVEAPFDDAPPSGYSGEWRVILPDGSTLSEGHYLDGRKSGEYKLYSGGRWVVKTTCANGIPHGLSIMRDYSGVVIAEGMYIDGKKWEGTFGAYSDASCTEYLVEAYSSGSKTGERRIEAWTLKTLHVEGEAPPFVP